jgi:hypothetical protein
LGGEEKVSLLFTSGQQILFKFFLIFKDYIFGNRIFSPLDYIIWNFATYLSKDLAIHYLTIEE